MKIPTSSSMLSFVFVLLLSTFSWAPASADSHQAFLQCLTRYANNSTLISQIIYTPNNSSFTPILQYSIHNPRFAKPTTPKPLVIVTPVNAAQIQTVVYCSKKHDMQIRTRCGGHSFEGLSYTSEVPFVLLDMINLRSVNVDVKSKTAWVETGATNGELYYRIAEKSRTLGFPSGLWSIVGVGGIISGGGYGMLRRTYGLAADNTIDALFIDVNGRILNRKSMGEDLFWAIRGGGGASFGIILSYKINLVYVPKVVTVFRISRTLEQNATMLFHRWQYVAPQFPKKLDIRCIAQSILSNSSAREDNKTIQVLFESLYLGGVDTLLPVMQQRFPELGLVKEDCSEVSWIQAAVFLANFTATTPIDTLLNRSAIPRSVAFKGKSDFVKEPISVEGLEGIWERVFQLDPRAAFFLFTPWGGRMSEISESALPYPHRAGISYMINHNVFTDNDEAERIEWMRSLYRYLLPYVSPRTAYVNYVDLDLGRNNEQGSTSYEQANKWGKIYFKNNFDRLVKVKSVVDPDNFFKHEQSIPPLAKWSDM